MKIVSKRKFCNTSKSPSSVCKKDYMGMSQNETHRKNFQSRLQHTADPHGDEIHIKFFHVQLKAFFPFHLQFLLVFSFPMLSIFHISYVCTAQHPAHSLWSLLHKHFCAPHDDGGKKMKCMLFQRTDEKYLRKTQRTAKARENH